MHKSQGFGVEVERGERKEYFKFLEGEPIKEGGGIFDAIDTTWGRVPHPDGLSAKVRDILKSYDATRPSASVPSLCELRKTLRDLGDNDWASEKLSDIDRIIAACLGLHLEAVTEKTMAQPGENLTLQIEAINRSPVEIKLQSLRVLSDKVATPVGKILAPNELFTQKATVALPQNLPFSQPYWLRAPGTLGTYAVSDQTLIGRPENPPDVPVEITLRIGDETLTYSLAPRFRKVDRVAGEVSEPLVIAPPAFV